MINCYAHPDTIVNASKQAAVGCPDHVCGVNILQVDTTAFIFEVLLDVGCQELANVSKNGISTGICAAIGFV
jgi:hypothetical protein